MELQWIVADGQLIVAMLIALAAGLISFASPCVLPLVPGYLAYVGGVAGSDEQGVSRWRMALGALLFVLGFTVVFVVPMVFAGTVAAWLLTWQTVLYRVLGVIVILMGFVFMGLGSKAQQTKRLRFKPAVGLGGAPLLGVVFAIGWAPCIGPTLATIFALSFEQGSAGRAATLAVAYSIGLGVPFILIALGLGWMTKVTGFLRRNIRPINIAGGVLMILIGLSMVTGLWNMMMASLQGVIDGFLPPL